MEISGIVKKMLRYDRVSLLERASRRYLTEHREALGPFGGLQTEELRSHVIDLNADIASLSAEEKSRWFDNARNKLRLHRFQIRLARTLKIVREETDPKLLDSLLDYGAGSGIFLQALGGGTGLDSDTGCVAEMQRKGVRAVLSHSESLPFTDGSFAYGSIFECLEHVENPVKLLQEMKRVTRMKIFISVPYVEKTQIGSFDPHERKRMENYHYFEFNLADLRKICERLGLTVSRVEHITPYEPAGLPILYRLLDRIYPGKLMRPEWTFLVLKRSE